MASSCVWKHWNGHVCLKGPLKFANFYLTPFAKISVIPASSVSDVWMVNLHQPRRTQEKSLEKSTFETNLHSHFWAPPTNKRDPTLTSLVWGVKKYASLSPQHLAYAGNRGSPKPRTPPLRSCLKTRARGSIDEPKLFERATYRCTWSKKTRPRQRKERKKRRAGGGGW